MSKWLRNLSKNIIYVILTNMCGIFGIINEKEKTFDRHIFNTLGVNNDTRGGDSCGIFIDGNVEYGVDKKKLYSSFYKESLLLNNVKKTKIAIGHCRKASVGAVSEATAQPIIIYNEKGEPDFVLMHNGTIFNYKELAKKYIPNIDITGLTDSQVMARIFYHSGYDALEEYNGGAVFVIIDYREGEPQVMFFKGASKKTSYSKEEDEERPFYFKRTKNSFYFSSIPTYLDTLIESDLYTLNCNSLVKLVKNRLETVEIIDRSKASQSNSSTSTTVFRSESYYDKASESIYGYNYDNYYNEYGLYGSKYLNNKDVKNKSLITMDDNFTFFDSDNITLHGRFSINEMGEIVNSENKSNSFWFWDGKLLKNEKCFEFLTKFCKEYGCDEFELESFTPEILSYLCYYPTRIDFLAYKFGDKYIKSLDGKEFSEFNGTLYELGDNGIHYVREGIIKNTVVNTKSNNYHSVRWELNKTNKDFFDNINNYIIW